jgi:hypothetical protein
MTAHCTTNEFSATIYRVHFTQQRRYGRRQAGEYFSLPSFEIVRFIAQYLPHRTQALPLNNVQLMNQLVDTIPLLGHDEVPENGRYFKRIVEIAKKSINPGILL